MTIEIRLTDVVFLLLLVVAAAVDVKQADEINRLQAEVAAFYEREPRECK